MPPEAPGLTLWSASRRPRALSAYAQLGLGDRRVNQIGGYLGGGLTLTAPLPSRGRTRSYRGSASLSHVERSHASFRYAIPGNHRLRTCFM